MEKIGFYLDETSPKNCKEKFPKFGGIRDLASRLFVERSRNVILTNFPLNLQIQDFCELKNARILDWKRLIEFKIFSRQEFYMCVSKFCVTVILRDLYRFWELRKLHIFVSSAVHKRYFLNQLNINTRK